MRNPRKSDLDHRLETYLSTLRSSPLRETVKRRVGNWQIYAAVSSSAVAMLTGASTAIIGRGIQDVSPEPIASFRSAKHLLTSSKNPPVINAVRLAMAKDDSRARYFNARAAKTSLPKRKDASRAPSISPSGVVPLSSDVNMIEAGELVSIHGSDLSRETVSWNGDFPTTLGGTSVQINGKPAFLMLVSPELINLQAPDDTALGTVSVVVTTAAGTATSTVTLSQFAPAFKLRDAKHVEGIIWRSNHSGAYGGGSYDILGPTGNSLGYPTVAARPDDSISLFGVGFGPTTPAVPAGQAFSGTAPVNSAVTLYINNVPVKPTFAGLTSAGLYQINLIVPSNLGPGDLSIQAMVGGMRTQPNAYFPLRIHSGFPAGAGGTVVGGTGSTAPVIFFTTGGIGPGMGGTGGGIDFPGGGMGGGTGGGMPGGTGGGMGGGMAGGTGGGMGGDMGGGTGGGGTGGGGSGGGSGGSSGNVRNPYQPKLRFDV